MLVESAKFILAVEDKEQDLKEAALKRFKEARSAAKKLGDTELHKKLDAIFETAAAQPEEAQAQEEEEVERAVQKNNTKLLVMRYGENGDPTMEMVEAPKELSGAPLMDKLIRAAAPVGSKVFVMDKGTNEEAYAMYKRFNEQKVVETEFKYHLFVSLLQSVAMTDADAMMKEHYKTTQADMAAAGAGNEGSNEAGSNNGKKGGKKKSGKKAGPGAPGQTDAAPAADPLPPWDWGMKGGAVELNEARMHAMARNNLPMHRLRTQFYGRNVDSKKWELKQQYQGKEVQILKDISATAAWAREQMKGGDVWNAPPLKFHVFKMTQDAFLRLKGRFDADCAAFGNKFVPGAVTCAPGKNRPKERSNYFADLYLKRQYKAIGGREGVAAKYKEFFEKAQAAAAVRKKRAVGGGQQ